MFLSSPNHDDSFLFVITLIASTHSPARTENPVIISPASGSSGISVCLLCGWGFPKASVIPSAYRNSIEYNARACDIPTINIIEGDNTQVDQPRSQKRTVEDEISHILTSCSLSFPHHSRLKNLGRMLRNMSSPLLHNSLPIHPNSSASSRNSFQKHLLIGNSLVLRNAIGYITFKYKDFMFWTIGIFEPSYRECFPGNTNKNENYP